MDSQPNLKREGQSDDSLTTPHRPTPVPQPSEGGVRAWCTVIGGYVSLLVYDTQCTPAIAYISWLALFATFGSAASFGVYQDFYVRSGTSTSSNVAFIGSVQLFLLTGMGLPAGKLLDKGYFRHVVLVGSIIYVFR